MRKIISLVILNFCCITLHGQCILIKLNLSDCQKCQVILDSYITSKKSSIPVFTVFPDNMKMDSTDIKSMLSSGVAHTITFDSYYYKLLDGLPMSSVAYLSESGQITYQVGINEFNEKSKGIIDSLYQSGITMKTDKPLWIEYSDGKKIIYNTSLSYVKVEHNGQTYKYSADKNILDLCIRQLNNFYPGFYDYTLKGKDLGAPDIFFQPKIGGFCMIGNTSYFVVKVPFAEKVMDSILRQKMHGDSVVIDSKFTMVKKEEGKDFEAYPIDAPYEIKGRQSSYSFVYSSVAMPDDSTLIVFYNPGDWKKYPKEIQYLAELKLKNGVWRYSRHLKNEIDSIYLNKGIDYRAFSIFESFDYPYYISSLSTQISNIENETDHRFRPAFSADYSHVDSNYVRNIMRRKINEPIRNRALFNDKLKKLLYLITAVNKKDLYLTVFSTKNMSIVQTIDLNRVGLNIKEGFPYFGFNHSKGIFLIEDGDNNVRSIPAALIINHL